MLGTLPVVVVATFALGQAIITCPDNSWTYDANADRCYKVIESGTHRTCSMENCPRLGASLVCIRTDASNKIVADLFGDVTARFWIGLYRNPALEINVDTWHEGWQWANGCQSTYTNFRVSEPNNWCLQEYCASSYGEPLWNDCSCGLRLPCVCEYPSNSTQQYGNAELPTEDCKSTLARKTISLLFWCVCLLLVSYIFLPCLWASMPCSPRIPSTPQACKSEPRMARVMLVMEGILLQGGCTAVFVSVLLSGHVFACSTIWLVTTLCGVLAALLTAVLILKRSAGSSSDYGKRFLAILYFQFVLALARAWRDGFHCRFAGPEIIIFEDFVRLSSVLQWPLLDALVILRAAALAENLGWAIWVKCLSWLWRAELLGAISFSCFHLIEAFHERPLSSAGLETARILCIVIALLMHVTFSMLFVSSLIVALGPLKAAACTPWGHWRQQALTRCRRAGWLQVLAMVLQTFIQTFLASVYVCDLKNITISGIGAGVFLGIVGAADDFTNIFLIVTMTGISGFSCVHADVPKFRQALKQSRLARQGTMRSVDTLCEDPAWCSVVADLAGRGFILEQLLEFYKVTLRSRMPHFDPDVHRTVDVVRWAVIPESASTQSSCSEHMMRGTRIFPSTMVTHNWSNLFRDLVAVIIADALGEPTFMLVAQMLDHDFESLGKLLTPAMLARSYWLCAFSIDQHSAICNEAWDCDPVTGDQHPICQCGKTKHGSLAEPYTSSGKSIPCQMNKFSDMMAFLAKHYGLRHIIAVDRHFQLFTRAWCVAEIAEGHRLGLPQDMKIYSFDELSAQTSTLKGLDIRNMRASRPEDVEEILAGIPDVAAFNSHLQEMLFGDHGLVMVLEVSDALQQMECIGKMARLARVLGPLSSRRGPPPPRCRPQEEMAVTCGYHLRSSA